MVTRYFRGTEGCLLIIDRSRSCGKLKMGSDVNCAHNMLDISKHPNCRSKTHRVPEDRTASKSGDMIYIFGQ